MPAYLGVVVDDEETAAAHGGDRLAGRVRRGRGGPHRGKGSGHNVGAAPRTAHGSAFGQPPRAVVIRATLAGGVAAPSSPCVHPDPLSAAPETSLDELGAERRRRSGGGLGGAPDSLRATGGSRPPMAGGGRPRKTTTARTTTRVLVVGTDDWAIEQRSPGSRPAAEGQRSILRCHEPGSRTSPATPSQGGTCPLDVGFDVVATVRARPLRTSRRANSASSAPCATGSRWWSPGWLRSGPSDRGPQRSSNRTEISVGRVRRWPERPPIQRPPADLDVQQGGV